VRIKNAEICKFLSQGYSQTVYDSIHTLLQQIIPPTWRRYNCCSQSDVTVTLRIDSLHNDDVV